MAKKRLSRLILLPLFLIACIGLVVLEIQARPLRRAVDNLVYDNWNHYLPCKKLPTEAQVTQIVERHQITIQAIDAVNPGLVGVEIDNYSCPGGRADLVIWYAKHQDRLAIESIIGGDTFLGVPYRLQNR
jgi:hypothetical protein